MAYEAVADCSPEDLKAWIELPTPPDGSIDPLKQIWFRDIQAREVYLEILRELRWLPEYPSSSGTAGSDSDSFF